MQRLRHAKHLAAFALLWFLVSLCISVASPLVSAKPLEQVCSSGGLLKQINTSGDESSTSNHSNHSLDCPLCMTAGIPPMPLSAPFTKPSPLAHALQLIEAAHIASATAPPLPSSGPPAI